MFNIKLSTKVLENKGKQVSKTNKPISKQAVHLDYLLLRQLTDIACRYLKFFAKFYETMILPYLSSHNFEWQIFTHVKLSPHN
jgi:hypothetical protein